MSRVELKSIVDRSSAEDRLFLAAYLQHVTARDDATLQRELMDAHQEIASGRKIRLTGLKRLHTGLVRAGL